MWNRLIQCGIVIEVLMPLKITYSTWLRTISEQVHNKNETAHVFLIVLCAQSHSSYCMLAVVAMHDAYYRQYFEVWCTVRVRVLELEVLYCS